MCWKKLTELWERIWNGIFKRSHHPNTLLDTVKLKLFGLEIDLSRELPQDIPYELTVVVPRAELRTKKSTNSVSDSETEILLNSITVAHSPRLEGVRATPPTIPREASPK